MQEVDVEGRREGSCFPKLRTSFEREQLRLQDLILDILRSTTVVLGSWRCPNTSLPTTIHPVTPSSEEQGTALLHYITVVAISGFVKTGLILDSRNDLALTLSANLTYTNI